jgi:hypothetical protein
MKHALICPVQEVYDNGAAIGVRVADVAAEPFPVALPMFWVECDDAVEPDVYYYDPQQERIMEAPIIRPQDLPPVEVIDGGINVIAD